MATSPSALLDLVSRIGLLDPRRAAALTSAVARWGPTLAAPVAASALVSPRGTAVSDRRGRLTHAELDRRSTRLAKGFHALGVGRGARLGVLCRNHRDFVEVTVAAAKASLEVVYLNTGSAGPQVAEIVEREGIDALVVDGSLAHLVDADRFGGPVVLADVAGGRDHDGGLDLSAVRGRAGWRPLLASLPLAPVLLTSGTTGTPKGARRGTGRPDASASTGVLREIPYRCDDVVAITSPLFHAWGLAQLALCLALGARAVVSDTFDPAETLRRIEDEHVTVLAVVPVILQRLLAHPALERTDLSRLRITASSGSALPVPVVTGWLDRVGPHLYNLYGSTEVGQATMADPTELARHPDTAGHVLPGSVVRILDADGRVCPDGVDGRIFVGGSSQFEEYTGGGGKEIVDGLMSSGDVGHLADGLLFVTGRADDMIVSGGENVFPAEIEDLLLGHDAVDDVAVVGVADDEFGQRLAAHVVVRDGASLTAGDVRSLVGSHLARHKVPRDVHFLDELPRTTTGKVRRGRLAG
ncbi:AMP-binding protein [Ilumatobacter sp.]|uniref:AMP-binding protein n=1 Tax=Ilumatobacter sp. TaxID=1967498 RepID=UPI003B5212CE